MEDLAELDVDARVEGKVELLHVTPASRSVEESVTDQTKSESLKS